MLIDRERVMNRKIHRGKKVKKNAKSNLKGGYATNPCLNSHTRVPLQSIFQFLHMPEDELVTSSRPREAETRLKTLRLKVFGLSHSTEITRRAEKKSVFLFPSRNAT